MALEHDDPHLDLVLAERAFEVTGNPLFAWKAVSHCIKSRYPFPENVAAYLVKVADTLVKQSEGRDKYSDVAMDVRDAVFGPAKNLDGGQGSHYTDYDRDWNRIKFTLEVAIRSSGFDIASVNPGGAKDIIRSDSGVGAAILEYAKEYELDEEVARKAYYKWMKLLAPKSDPI